MKFLKIILFISLIIPVGQCLAVEQSGLSFPNFPMAFWGTVTINGNPAPITTVVKAYYGDILAGQVVINENGIYGYTESTKQKLVVGEGDGLITFKFQSAALNSGNETGGTTPQTYSEFQSGQTIEKDLSFILENNNTGGNSGGGSPIPPVIPMITKKGDANGDNKVDKYDFSLMMSNWGKTGTNICDFNGDGKVDKYDFALLMLNWSI